MTKAFAKSRFVGVKVLWPIVVWAAPLLILMASGQKTFAAATFPVTLTCPAGTGQLGAPYSSGFMANGGKPPYNFAIVGGALPPGLALNPTLGSISGTPTNAGVFGFMAGVTDSTN